MELIYLKGLSPVSLENISFDKMDDLTDYMKNHSHMKFVGMKQNKEIRLLSNDAETVKDLTELLAKQYKDCIIIPLFDDKPLH